MNDDEGGVVAAGAADGGGGVPAGAAAVAPPETPAATPPAETETAAAAAAAEAPREDDQSETLRRSWAALRRRQREVERLERERADWIARQPKLTRAAEVLERDPIAALMELGVTPEQIAERVIAEREGRPARDIEAMRRELEELRAWREKAEEERQVAQATAAIGSLIADAQEYAPLREYASRLGIDTSFVAREVLGVLEEEARETGREPDVRRTLRTLSSRLSALLGGSAPPQRPVQRSAPKTAPAGGAAKAPAAPADDSFEAALEAMRRTRA